MGWMGKNITPDKEWSNKIVEFPKNGNLYKSKTMKLEIDEQSGKNW